MRRFSALAAFKKKYLKSLVSLDTVTRLHVNAETQQKDSKRYLESGGIFECNISLGERGVLGSEARYYDLGCVLAHAAALPRHTQGL